MFLTRLGQAAAKSSVTKQARKKESVFVPSAVLLTLSGFGLSLFGLTKMDTTRRLKYCK